MYSDSCIHCGATEANHDLVTSLCPKFENAKDKNSYRLALEIAHTWAEAEFGSDYLDDELNRNKMVRLANAIEALVKELCGRGKPASLDQALNSGDGAYRP